MKVFIYKIQNLENGKLYIGSTSRPRKRWNEHKGNLNRNQHHSSYLQNSWNKYGEEMFEFTVIDECEIELQFTLEKEWVLKEKSHLSEWGYNMAVPTEGGGYVCTDYHKGVLREKSTIAAQKQWKEMRESGKSQIVVIDLVTEEKKYYPAKTDCPISFKNKDFNFAEKKFCTYTHNKTEEQIQQEFQLCQVRYENYLQNQTPIVKEKNPPRNASKSQIIFTSSTETLTFNNCKEAAEYFDMTEWGIYAFVKKGFLLRTKYTVQKEDLIDSAYKRVDLEKEHNLNKQMLTKLLSGDGKTHKGFSIQKEELNYSIGIP